jgi:hypothetical protein
MNAQDELRRELDQSLTSLVNSIASTELNQSDRDLLAEFIENFEYGVALEWLHSLIVERGIQLPREQEEQIQRLAQRMKIDLK